MKQSRTIFYRAIAFILLVLTAPLLFLLYIVVKTTSSGPFIFVQKRLGKNKKPFKIYKIRTMVKGADRLKKHYIKMNEADGPVFKIYNDPRYTKLGKFISHTGLDELPQLINIIKGEISFVGPRPLPIKEALRVPKKYEARFSVLPGITSSWVVGGSHKLTFEQWMKLDLDYVKNNNIITDITIIIKTISLIIGLIYKNIKLF